MYLGTEYVTGDSQLSGKTELTLWKKWCHKATKKETISADSDFQCGVFKIVLVTQWFGKTQRDIIALSVKEHLMMRRHPIRNASASFCTFSIVGGCLMPSGRIISGNRLFVVLGSRFHWLRKMRFA